MRRDEHGVDIQAATVKSCVDRELWISISQELLNPEHKTVIGERPNNEMTRKYVLGEAPYGKGRRAKLGIKAKIAAITFKKGPRGCTNEDRLIAYRQGLRKVLRRIPSSQQKSKNFSRMLAEVIRKAVRPPHLASLVNTAVMDGIDPSSGEYESKWHAARKDHNVAFELLKHAAEALDDLIRRGHANDE